MIADERERRAREELGRTAVSRGVARATTVAFLLAVFSLPVAQLAAQLGPGTRTPWADSALADCWAPHAWATPLPPEASTTWKQWRVRNEQLRTALVRCEGRLEEESRPWSWLQARAQRALTRWLRAGNEQVVVGKGQWLFYRPDIDALTAPGLGTRPASARVQSAADERVSDPVPAIVQLEADLRARGITLVVLPVPVKPAIDADRLAGAGASTASRLPANPAFAPLFAGLERRGVRVVDLTEAFLAARDHGPAYLATDTHWRPETVRRAADRTADAIRDLGVLAERPAAGFAARSVAVSATGDTAALLGLDGASSLFPPESVEVPRVVTSGGAPLRPQADADVLVMGDSFSNIYSIESLGWGSGAGFAEQLALALQRPVDRLGQNDRGAIAPREMLARELARGHDRLARTRVVVWQFTTRELVFGDWRVVPLPGPEATGVAAAPSTFAAPPSGETWDVTGRIAAMSPVPRPGSVPYRDHILSLHLVGLEGGPVRGGQAVVYTWSMRDFELTPAAGWQVGERVRLRLRAWSDVAREYDGVNRSELPDARLILEEPCWGDPVR